MNYHDEISKKYRLILVINLGNLLNKNVEKSVSNNISTIKIRFSRESVSLRNYK